MCGLYQISPQKNITSQDDSQKSGDEDYPSTLLYDIIYIIGIKKQDVSKATWLRHVAIHPKLVHRLDQRRMSSFHDP